MKIIGLLIPNWLSKLGLMARVLHVCYINTVVDYSPLPTVSV